MRRWACVDRISLSWIRSVVAVVAATVVGGSLTVALAQTLATVDARCAADCVGQGIDGEYCARACTPVDSDATGSDQEYDWVCVQRCRARDGRLRDCLNLCVRRC